MDYFLAGEMHEDWRISSGDVVLQDVKQASWSQRASRSSTYSSISLGIIIVAVFLLVANSGQIQTTQRNLLIWVILLASISVVLYGVSLQLWDEALGSGYTQPATLKLRRNALVLSSLGWITLVTALGLAVIVVHTPLGAAVGCSAIVAGLYIFEHKWRLAHQHCSPGLHNGGFAAYLRRLSSGQPDMRRTRHSTRAQS